MTTEPTFDPLDATRRERLNLCDHLDTLTSEQSNVPSLCSGWTVKDVVAHLTTSTQTTLGGLTVGIIRAGGNFDRMERMRALALSERFTTAELVETLRRTAGSASRAPFSSPLDPLLDVLVHGQDITRPLDQPRPMVLERAEPALEHAVTSRWYGAKARFDGLRIQSTDTSWAVGDGQLHVAGPTADLMLVATGRPAGLSALKGSGVAVLANRLALH